MKSIKKSLLDDLHGCMARSLRAIFLGSLSKAWVAGRHVVFFGGGSRMQFRSVKARSAGSAFGVALAVGSACLLLAGAAAAQSRPPISSGASGGSNPGGSAGGYNPGNNNSGGNYNPGNNSSGGGYNPGTSSGGSGYNPGNNSGGSGYNPGGYDRHSVTGFVDSRYRGRSISFSDAIPNLDDSGLNDRISSLRVRGTWLVCEDAYFRGRCESVRGDVRDLSRLGMNDRISSMRPIY